MRSTLDQEIVKSNVTYLQTCNINEIILVNVGSCEVVNVSPFSNANCLCARNDTSVCRVGIVGAGADSPVRLAGTRAMRRGRARVA